MMFGLPGIVALSCESRSFAQASDERGENSAVKVPVRLEKGRNTGESGNSHAGAALDIQVELIPDAVLISANKEKIEYHAEVTSTLKTDGVYVWTATVADDEGNLVQTIGRGDGNIARSSSTAIQGLSADLPDGFYALNFRVAAVGSEGIESATSTVQYLRIKGGKMRELSVDEWYTLSRARVAVDEGDVK